MTSGRPGLRTLPPSNSRSDEHDMSLRIIGGSLRRRHLKTPPGIATRPYTDRVRQIVFDRIVNEVPFARVADVFSGVGTMGLESLSRGADSCVFIEADREVHRALRDNVNQLAADFPTVCWKTDVRYTSFAPKGNESLLPYTIIFFDPPYAQCPSLESGCSAGEIRAASGATECFRGRCSADSANSGKIRTSGSCRLAAERPAGIYLP